MAATYKPPQASDTSSANEEESNRVTYSKTGGEIILEGIDESDIVNEVDIQKDTGDLQFTFIPDQRKFKECLVSEKFKPIAKDDDKVITRKKQKAYKQPSVPVETQLKGSQISAYKAQANYMLIVHGTLIGCLLFYSILISYSIGKSNYISLFQSLIIVLSKIITMFAFISSVIPFSMIFISQTAVTSISFIIITIIDIVAFMVIVSPIGNVVSIYYQAKYVGNAYTSMTADEVLSSIAAYSTYVYAVTAIYFLSFILTVFFYVLPTSEKETNEPEKELEQSEASTHED